MILEMDEDGNGIIEFEEFLSMMTHNIGDKYSQDELQKVFDILDHDKTKDINYKNLQKIADELGEKMTKDEIKEMIKRSDIDQDGIMSFHDFVDVITNKEFI